MAKAFVAFFFLFFFFAICFGSWKESNRRDRKKFLTGLLKVAILSAAVIGCLTIFVVLF